MKLVSLKRGDFRPLFSDEAQFYTGIVHTNPSFIPFFTGSQRDPGDFGVIVFAQPIEGITPALLPTAGLLDQFGPQGLHDMAFPTVGYGITWLLGGSAGGGPPRPGRDSAGMRMVAIQTFFSLTDAWLRLSMIEDGRVCIGDSGAPNFQGDTDLIVTIGIGGDFHCEAMGTALRLDTPTARAFLGQFVALP
jgi:hypothetical protein